MRDEIIELLNKYGPISFDALKNFLHALYFLFHYIFLHIHILLDLLIFIAITNII